MKTKWFLRLCVAGVLIGLLGTAGIVYYIDPYLQYHCPNENLSYNLEMNAFGYINPGIVKNYEYDTVITGSSMTRAFLPSYADEVFGGKTVKLSMAEARGKDYRQLFSLLEDEKDLKRVIMGLDTFAFNVDAEFTSYEKPEYLYDDNVFNDVYYLMNMDGVCESYKVLSYTAQGGSTTDMDAYQNYALTGTFSEENVLKCYKGVTESERKTEFDKDLNKEKIQDNLRKNVIPMIEQRKDVEFLCFFPPYSIVRWGNTVNVEEDLYTMQIMIETLLPYENVKLYFPQGKQEVIAHLDFYMDTIHYNSEVANGIVDDMYHDKERITEENYQEKLEEFYQFVMTYDYTKFENMWFFNTLDCTI